MKIVLVAFGICGYLLAIIAYFATPTEVRYVYLHSLADQGQPEPSMSRVSANPPLDVDAVAGGDSPSQSPLAGISPTLLSGSSPADSSPKFQNETLKAFTKQHPNSPLRFVPKDATELELGYLESQAEVVIQDWQARRDALLAKYGDDIVAFAADPEVRANDRDRQTKLKQLVLSLWPECGMKP